MFTTVLFTFFSTYLGQLYGCGRCFPIKRYWTECLQKPAQYKTGAGFTIRFIMKWSGKGLDGAFIFVLYFEDLKKNKPNKGGFWGFEDVNTHFISFSLCSIVETIAYS